MADTASQNTRSEAVKVLEHLRLLEQVVVHIATALTPRDESDTSVVSADPLTRAESSLGTFDDVSSSTKRPDFRFSNIRNQLAAIRRYASSMDISYEQCSTAQQALADESAELGTAMNATRPNPEIRSELTHLQSCLTGVLNMAGLALEKAMTAMNSFDHSLFLEDGQDAHDNLISLMGEAISARSSPGQFEQTFAESPLAATLRQIIGLYTDRIITSDAVYRVVEYTQHRNQLKVCISGVKRLSHLILSNDHILDRSESYRVIEVSRWADDAVRRLAGTAARNTRGATRNQLLEELNERRSIQRIA